MLLRMLKTGSKLSSSTDLTNQTNTTTSREQQSSTGSQTKAKSNTPTAIKMSRCNPNRRRASSQMALIGSILVVGLACSSSMVLAWNFNYQPELAPNQQTLSPQTYNNQNHQNNFYQPAANQFGNQYFGGNQAVNLLASQSQHQQPSPVGSQFLKPSIASNVFNGGTGGLQQAGIGQAGQGTNSFVGPPMFMPENRITSGKEVTVVDVPVASQLVRASNSGNADSTVAQTTTTLSEISRQTPIVSDRDQTFVGSNEPTSVTTEPSNVQSSTSPSSEHRLELMPDRSTIREPAADHDVVRSSPSPLGKIFDVMARDSSPGSSHANHTFTSTRHAVATAAAALLANSVHAAETSYSNREATDATQRPTTDIATATTTTTTTTTTKPPPTKQDQQQEPSVVRQVQVLKPLRRGAPTSKNPLKTIEQQIINQHARASFTNGQRYEPTTSPPQQQVRLLPNKSRDNKLLYSFLSAISDHRNSATTSGDLSSSSSDNNEQRQKATTSSGGQGLLSSLAESFKSGVTSRSSIVKAAMGDNKLARTLSTVGKTIGGNKYVAGAGIAAALAALGLTVSKLISPNVYAGPYSKLSPGFEPMTSSGSMLRPTYTNAGMSRNWLLYPAHMGGQQMGLSSSSNMDSMIAAANSQEYEHAFGGLQVPSMSTPGVHFGGPNGDSFNPNKLSGGPFVDSANGHYSDFYNQESGEPHLISDNQPSTPSLTYNTNGPPQQQGHQYGSYVSGKPTLSGYQTPHYSSQDTGMNQFDSAPDQPNQRPNPLPFFGYNTQPYVHYNNADQIVAAASSGVPFAELAPRRPFESGPRRSGAVSLKLNQESRALLKQQLQAESVKSSRLNLERLVAFRDQLASDQSNSMKLAASANRPSSQESFLPISGPVKLQQRNQATNLFISSTANNQAGQQQAVVPSSLPNSVANLKSGRLADFSSFSSSGMTSKSDYKGQAKRVKLPQQIVIRQQEQQTMSASPIRAGPMQTSRNETSATNMSRAPVYQFVAPNPGQTGWKASTDLSLPTAAVVGEQQANSGDNSGKDWQLQLQSLPPKVLANVDTATGQSDSITTKSGSEIASSSNTNLAWHSLESAKQFADNDGEKNSLSTATNESDSLGSATTDEANNQQAHNNNNNNNNNNNHRLPASTEDSYEVDHQPEASSTSSHRVSRRTPSSSGGQPSPSNGESYGESSAFATWQMIGMPERHLSPLRDYVSPSAPVVSQSKSVSTEGKSDALRAASHDEDNEQMDSTDAMTNSVPARRQDKQQQQRQDELIQVANGMGTNLIQLNRLTAGGAEYQIDTSEHNSSNSFESKSGSTDNKSPATKPNKPIEAKANPNINNAGSSKSLSGKLDVAAAPRTSVAQHDHHHHDNQQVDQRSLTAATAAYDDHKQQEDGVVVELLANDNDNNSANQKTADREQPRAATVDERQDPAEMKGDKRRLFRGLVAGSIGAI